MAEIVLGNHAIARGLLEGGLQLISAYPGTPSSEILPGAVEFSRRESWDIYAEWSVNERCAFELSLGASLEGIYAACCMKQVGFNVALPAFLGARNLNIKGSLVLCVADDPGPVSSQTEQDTRMLMALLEVPVFDPSSCEDARKFSKYAVSLSHALGIPVCVRPVARLSHMREAIELGERKIEHFEVDSGKDKVNAALELIEKLGDVNLFFEGERGDILVLSSGMSWSIFSDVARELDVSVSCLKVGTPFPFPHKLFKSALKGVSKVIVFEETDIVLERAALEFSGDAQVIGRTSGHVPREGELTYDVVRDVLRSSLGISKRTSVYLELKSVVDGLNLPKRPPVLCPGCGHRGAFLSIVKAFKEGIFPGDIGCYTLGIRMGAVDIFIDMGASVNLGSGFSEASRSLNIPVVATIGDSTFFHSGISSLYWAKRRGFPFILIILDNMLVAMTGGQPTPETGDTPLGEGRKVYLEDVVEAMGFSVNVINPYRVNELSSLLRKLWISGKPCVIIARRPCVLRYGAPEGRKRPFITEDCTGCGICIRKADCPSLYFDEDGKVRINQLLCTGCGVCFYACPMIDKNEKKP